MVKYTFSEAVQFITSDIKISNNLDNIQFMIAFNCKVIRVNYAYNHIDVRPVYNK